MNQAILSLKFPSVSITCDNTSHGVCEERSPKEALKIFRGRSVDTPTEVLRFSQNVIKLAITDERLEV